MSDGSWNNHEKKIPSLDCNPSFFRYFQGSQPGYSRLKPYPMSIIYIIKCPFNIHRGSMNISIGAPYEAVIKRIIEKGYAGNQTEVIRQAILAYERMLEEEELMLVHRAVKVEVREIEAKKTPSHSFGEIKEILTS
jgi:Arc/MetJ-type ribon-helix-helix transcriptional regulator